MKTQKVTSFIRIGAVILLTLIVAFFVQAYSALQANWLEYGLKIPLDALPLPTMFFYRHALVGYILPIAAAVAFALQLVGDSAWTAIEALLWIIIIFAVAWLLSCLLSWQLPLYYSAVRGT